MSDRSFGDQLRELGSTADIVQFEREGARADQFDAVDTVVAGLMIRAFRGERVATLTRTDRGDRLQIVGIPESLAVTMREAMQLEAQRSRGAWFLPETVPIKIQGLSFPSIFRATPRYAHTLAAEEKGKVTLTGSADAMVVWSVLQSFADFLVAPIFLRVFESGLLTRDGFGERWEDVTASLSSVGLTLERELAPLSWGGAWATFTSESQLEAKAGILQAISEQLSIEVVRRYRASEITGLVRQYYAKAKRGRAKRRQVITKERARTLAAYFGGDWLAFVNYLGEQPHEEEQIATALPEAKLIVTGKDRAAEIAAKRGLPIDEVERILGAYWKDSTGASPVLARTATLTEYWQQFDQIHARQSRGMRALWGLVEEGWNVVESSAETPYQQNLFRELLPQELLARIEQLWGTTVLAKWPDRVVTEPFPHSVMAETFGPALKFWHGCSLTAWFVCEGPRSRTDIPGLATYHRRELVALEDMGFPVHPQLFEELSAVPLGPEEPIQGNSSSVDVGYGVSLTIQTSSGTRRSGFELLRDVVTRHRRWWASQNLERYLRALWETELKEAARQFHLMTEEKGRPPTLKQFAKHTIGPAKHWFAGDASLLFAALGQKLTANIKRETQMPADRAAFVNTVFKELGGKPFIRQVVMASREAGAEQAAEQTRHHQLRRLAHESLTFMQLSEALGRAPTLNEFGPRFDYLAPALASDARSAWDAYVAAISSARQRSNAQQLATGHH